MGHISILLLDHENMKHVNSVKTEHTKNIENQKKKEGKIRFDDICVMIKMLEVNFYFYFIFIIIFFVDLKTDF